ncbi:MAG TPA: NAD(P)H-binding protein [Pseudonocardia sp.]|jgi:NAD(P)H dehydrogenase (quinone)|nr:NAD(P)H-binding protein [Pseudonocardia sp.]
MIVITGANGQLGRLVIQNLLASVPATEIVAAVRRPEQAADLAELGIAVREADYDRPELWPAALEGATEVLLISASGLPGNRGEQHRVVIDAAKAAGTVRRIFYTGVLGGDAAGFRLADDHKATERILRESGLAFTVLRDGWYTEMYTDRLPLAVRTGSFGGTAAPSSRLATATRAEYAEAAVAALLTKGPQPEYYELSGDSTWSLTELADEFTRQTGTHIVYRQISPEEHRAALVADGLPELLAEILVDVDAGIDRGELARQDGTLARLIGHPTAPLSDTVATAVTALKADTP